MTPRPRASPLALAFLLSALPARPETRPGEATALPGDLAECPFFYASAEWESSGRPLPPEACRAAREWRAYFLALRTAADIAGPELSLAPAILDAPYYNAFYDPSSRRVSLTRGFVECHRAVPETAAFVIAHEIGHAVQDKHGLLPQGVVPTDARGLADNRRSEGHADRAGRELMGRARMPFPQAASWERFLGCTGRMDEYLSRHSHPAGALRWAAAVADERARGPATTQAGARVEAMLGRTGVEEWRDFSAAGALEGGAAAGGERRRGRVFGAITQLDEDGDAVQTQAPYRVRAGDYRPATGLAAFTEQGVPAARVSDMSALHAGIPEPFSRPNEAGTAALTLAHGVVWVPPASPLTPAEILVYATRYVASADTPRLEPRRAFTAALSFVVENRAWEYLPGTVSVDSSNKNR